MGHSFANYVDDLYLQGNTYKLCLDYVMATFQIFRAMGLYYTQWSQNHPKTNHCRLLIYHILHQYDFAPD